MKRLNDLVVFENHSVSDFDSSVRHHGQVAIVSDDYKSLVKILAKPKEQIVKLNGIF